MEREADDAAIGGPQTWGGWRSKAVSVVSAILFWSGAAGLAALDVFVITTLVGAPPDWVTEVLGIGIVLLLLACAPLGLCVIGMTLRPTRRRAIVLIILIAVGPVLVAHYLLRAFFGAGAPSGR